MRLVCNEAPKCANCNSHFQELRPNLKEAIITNHFKKDIKDKKEISNIVNDVLDCKHANFSELHKFEEHVNGISVFRAKKERTHYVYAVEKSKIIFLRALKNYREYAKFLENKKQILHTIRLEYP